MLRVVHGLDDAIEMRQWLHKQPTVAMDTETTGVDVFAPGFKVRLTQFGTKDEAWVIPTEGWEGFVGELIRDYDGRMLMHNARYDILALSRVGVDVPWRKVDDTMIALRLSEPHMSAALKTAATRHVSTVAAAGQLDLTSAMRIQKWDWATVPLDFDPYVFYAAMDTVLTARLAETPICREGFRSPVYQLEMDYRALATRMEELGLRVDLDHCREADEQLQAEIHHSTEMIRDRFDVDVMSTQQLTRWLMGAGAKISKRTAKGSPSVDRESLELIIAEHPKGDITLMAQTALRIRALTKLSSSYFRNFIELAQDGLLHPSIETIAARTGRTSIREPALQTLPRGDNPDAKLVRTAVIPRTPDELLVSCDYEQIELRLMAAESGDAGLVEAFAHADSGGADFFTSAMRTVYGDPDLPKSDPRRTLIKVLFYAASYGAGVAKMAQTAGVPEDEMRDIHSRVFARYPGVKTLMRRLESEVHANDGWVETPFGRRIYIDEDHAYKALNARIQGFAADLFKKAAVDMAQAGLADFMVVPVHDEMLFSIPVDILEDVRPVIENTMTMSWKGVGLPAAPSDGYETWGKVPK